MSEMPTRESLGADRVLEPLGALPQAALRLDAGGPARSQEIEIEVELLNLDSTSFRQISEEVGGEPERIGHRIAAIVAERGKMHNPVTGSGGILTGTIRAVGEGFPDPPRVGDRVVTLASLTLTPLRLDSVGPVDPSRPQVPVTGTAYLPATAPWAPYPQDLPLPVTLAALDVCGAAPQTRQLVKPGDTVLVLGAGHAGLLALAAARDALAGEGQLVAIDADAAAGRRAREMGLCDHALEADLRDALGSLDVLRNAGLPRADVTVVVVNATGCEAASILLTKDTGTILFFSMATSFTGAALGSEGVASTAKMMVGSGYFPDRGAYALELVRRIPALQEAYGGDQA